MDAFNDEDDDWVNQCLSQIPVQTQQMQLNSLVTHANDMRTNVTAFPNDLLLKNAETILQDDTATDALISRQSLMQPPLTQPQLTFNFGNNDNIDSKLQQLQEELDSKNAELKSVRCRMFHTEKQKEALNRDLQQLRVEMSKEQQMHNQELERIRTQHTDVLRFQQQERVSSEHRQLQSSIRLDTSIVAPTQMYTQQPSTSGLTSSSTTPVKQPEPKRHKPDLNASQISQHNTSNATSSGFPTPKAFYGRPKALANKNASQQQIGGGVKRISSTQVGSDLNTTMADTHTFTEPEPLIRPNVPRVDTAVQVNVAQDEVACLPPEQLLVTYPDANRCLLACLIDLHLNPARHGCDSEDSPRVPNTGQPTFAELRAAGRVRPQVGRLIGADVIGMDDILNDMAYGTASQ